MLILSINLAQNNRLKQPVYAQSEQKYYNSNPAFCQFFLHTYFGYEASQIITAIRNSQAVGGMHAG